MKPTLFRRVMVAFGDDAVDAALLLQVKALRPPPNELHVVNAREDGGSESAAALVERMDRMVRTTPFEQPGPRITCAVLSGPTLDALIGYAHQHDVELMVVGHRRERSARSLARRLARRAHCAVWMVPDGVRPGVRRVVVPTDFSETAGRALEAALALCRTQPGSSCLVVNIVARAGEGPMPAEPSLDGDRARALSGHDTTGVPVEFLREEAVDVAEGVARVVGRTGADFVCMGARGRTRAAAVLLGSATEDVLARMGCPVLVIRCPDRPLSLFQVLAQRVFSEVDRPRSIG